VPIGDTLLPQSYAECLCRFDTFVSHEHKSHLLAGYVESATELRIFEPTASKPFFKLSMMAIVVHGIERWDGVGSQVHLVEHPRIGSKLVGRVP